MEQIAQTGDRNSVSSLHVRGRGLIRLAVGFVAAALVLIGVFDAAEWYAGKVSIPRYCGSPDATLELVREAVSERHPASEAGTRPYVVAAKLIYLIPQRDGEPVDDYLSRLRLRIAESCW